MGKILQDLDVIEVLGDSLGGRCRGASVADVIILLSRQMDFLFHLTTTTYPIYSAYSTRTNMHERISIIRLPTPCAFFATVSI